MERDGGEDVGRVEQREPRDGGDGQGSPGSSSLATVAVNTGAGATGEIADVGLRTLGGVLMARILGPADLGSWLVARTVAFDFSSILARCGLD